VLLRFLSGKRKKVLTGFVCLIPVQVATGETNIPFDEKIKIRGQRFANCFGFTKNSA
jgi:hypothetical protein